MPAAGRSVVEGEVEGEGDLAAENRRLRRRIERERAARLEAESIAERGLRELYEEQRQLALLERISTAANQMRSVEEALQLALAEICRFTDWPVGHAYLVDPITHPPVLRSSGIWHLAHLGPTEPFRAATATCTFTPGVGLPGRVLATGHPAWVTHVGRDDNFPRAQAATACGLASALALPVAIGAEVVGVLEFYAGRELGPDEKLLRLAGHIGVQIGRAIERKRAEDKLIHDALHDALTGLPNRLMLQQCLERAFGCERDSAAAGIALLFVDLDDFKLVNDGLGHHAGDALLVEVSCRLRAALPAGAILARMGGDEFTVLLDPLTDPEAAPRAADALHMALHPAFEIGGRHLHVGCSIGITTGPGGYRSAEAMLRDADLAMYQAKVGTKDGTRVRTRMFDQGMHMAALGRLQIEEDLRRGLAEGEFVLHYQPIVRLDTRVVSGFEALVRWQPPGMAMVPPGDFIPVAEETGLIVGLGRWVLRDACQTARAWHDRLPGAAAPTVSINLSARQFAEPHLVEHVREALEEAGIAPFLVRLEITEGVAMSDPRHAVRVLEALKRLGVLLSVDDFGTGHSSLSYLQSFPLDILKIDRSFVSRMQQDSGSQRIVDAILSLARALGLQVVAEGIEEAAQEAYLRQAGCEYGQGYLFSRPLSAEAVHPLFFQDALWLKRTVAESR